MKVKIIYLAISSLFLTSTAFAQTKTLDFYSSNGNRYSVTGKVKDLNLPVTNNSILLTDANRDAYVKLNNESPYHLNLIETDLNLYQIIDFNKGKSITYKGSQVKIIGSQNDKVIVELDNNIMFIPFDEISIPKSFLNDAKKGLKASFIKNINPEDTLFFSQPERQLSFNNSYESVIKDNKMNLSHYLNINNSSLNTFENVYLNFFLSETNIQEKSRLMPAPMMAMRGVSNRADMEAAAAPPVFNPDTVQNLKSISIKDPTTIYPNLNKIKYVDKSYEIEQYAKLQLADKYEIYFNEVEADLKNINDIKIKGTALNNFYVERLEQIKEMIKSSSNEIQNIIEVKIDKNDILPRGKFDVYETVRGQDKLIVSTTISHTENNNLEVLKSKNNDLKIINIDLEEINNATNLKDIEKYKKIVVKLKSIEIENKSEEVYIINILGKKTKIGANQKVKISN